MKHGTCSGYSKGCRCPRCVTANTEYWKRYRELKQAELNGRSRRRYSQRSNAGECPCGKPKQENRARCSECLQRNRDGVRRLQKKRVQNGLCGNCGKIPRTPDYWSCEPCRIALADKNRAIKLEVFAVYGGPVCRCCGETEIVFLTIDHIDNDGNIHRKQIKNTNITRWLKSRGYPSGYQVLCMNCNHAKRFGPCPHILTGKS